MDIHTGPHHDSSDELLADEVSDLDFEVARLSVLLDVDVDGEMGVDVAHLVLETLGDTDDQVVDEGSDGSESSDIFSRSVVNLNANNILLRPRKVDSDVAQVLGELASGALNGDVTGLDVDLDSLRNLQGLETVNVSHLCGSGEVWRGRKGT